MTTLAEQIDDLRDGDVVRVEWDDTGAHLATEGVVSHTVNGSLHVGRVAAAIIRRPDGSVPGDLTAVRVLVPVLRPGDRVRHRNAGMTGVVRRVSSLSVEVTENDCPSCEGKEFGCHFWATGDCERLPAEPEPPAVEVGQWWTFEDGEPQVVTGIRDGRMTMRRWDWGPAEEVEWDVTIDPDVLLERWTRLDGPPEPPPHAVIAVQDHDGNWHCAYRSKGWGDYGGTRKAWAQILDGKRVETLRVLAVLDGAEAG